MTVEILAVGTELLMGQIANTNAQYISQKLAELGMNVYFHSVVGDNAARLEDTLRKALERSDIVITTGGLGPTKDDLTKETIAKTMNRELILDEDILEQIKEYFWRKHRQMVLNNEKQAYLPERAITIPNPNGTAPGCIIEEGEKVVIMLPGPPKEMYPMFEATVFPYLRDKTGLTLASKMLKIYGIGESELETLLIDLVENQSNPTIAPYVAQGDVTIRVTARCATRTEALALMYPVVTEIRNRLGEMLYSEEGETLEQVVYTLLKEKGLVLATAESCTGGLLAGIITSIPGSSAIFEQGYITYSNQAKTQELDVSEDTLARFGAVSSETALEMVKGLQQKTGASVAVSITGIAGPDGGTTEKPVGLVYIAIAVNGEYKSKQFNFFGNRERVRNDACLSALDMIRRGVLGLEI